MLIKREAFLMLMYGVLVFCLSISCLLSYLGFFNVDFVEHLSAVTGLLFSCVIELLICYSVSKITYFYNGTGQIPVSLFTLGSAILSMRAH